MDDVWASEGPWLRRMFQEVGLYSEILIKLLTVLLLLLQSKFLPNVPRTQCSRETQSALASGPHWLCTLVMIWVNPDHFQEHCKSNQLPKSAARAAVCVYWLVTTSELLSIMIPAAQQVVNILFTIAYWTKLVCKSISKACKHFAKLCGSISKE